MSDRSPRLQLGRLARRLSISQRDYGAMRIEAHAAAARLGNLLDPRKRRTLAALREQRGLSLNLGSGGRGLDDWVNVDLCAHADTTVRLDLRRPLPFADGQFDRAFAEHVLEHLDFREEAPRLLAELHRVLRPGAVLRVVVPDAEGFVRAFASGDRDSWLRLGWDPEQLPDDMHTPMQVLNHIFHQGGEHKFGYDFATLQWLLRTVGFAEVTRQSFGVSADPALAIDQPLHRAYSLYVDARRP